MYSPDFKIRQQAKAANMEFASGKLCGRMVNINCISNSNNLLNRLIAVVERKVFFNFLNRIFSSKVYLLYVSTL